MKIVMISVGKTFQSFIQEGIAEYEKRLHRYTAFEHIIIPDVKNAGKLAAHDLKLKEGEAILKQFEQGDYVILLDDKGRSFTSMKFADFIQKRFNSGGKRLVFVIGGAFGFSEEVYTKADFKLSLSSLTFSHQMVRLFFIEQIYRAMTILKGEPYHHE